MALNERQPTKSSQKLARDSTKSQDYVTDNDRTSVIELNQRDGKGQRVSTKSLDKYGGKNSTSSRRIQEQAENAANVKRK